MVAMKQQNRPQIILYTAVQFVAFSWVLGGGAFPADWPGRVAAMTTSAVASGVIALAQILYSGLLGDRLKAILVFWRLKCPLPGCRAFSEIAPRDPRVSLDGLKACVGADFPTDPHEQNRLWYRIYQRHKDEPPVLDAHGNYLLARELACLSMAFLVLLPGLALILGVHWTMVLFYAVGLIVIYALIALSGRYYGRRFVANVLAIESSLPEIKQ